MALQVPRYYRDEIVESSASTYTEKSIDTNVAFEGNQIALIYGFEAIFKPLVFDIVAGDDDGLSIQVCYSSQSGIIGLDDPDLIIGMRFAHSLTTSGATGAFFPMSHFPAVPIPIAKQNLYVGAKSESLGAPFTYDFRILWELKKVSASEFNRLAQVCH